VLLSRQRSRTGAWGAARLVHRVDVQVAVRRRARKRRALVVPLDAVEALAHRRLAVEGHLRSGVHGGGSGMRGEGRARRGFAGEWGVWRVVGSTVRGGLGLG
jgi:hypothetical protein